MKRRQFLKAAGLAAHGAFRLEAVAPSSLALLPALLGMGAGQVIRRRASSSNE